MSEMVSTFERTKARRTPAEERAWADRVRSIAAQADAALMRHGATAEDLVRENRPLDMGDRLRGALWSFFATLTAEQRAAMQPASRIGEATAGTVFDLWEGLTVRGDHVMMYDEFVPIAETVWPEE